jgi:hypothetical protein
MPFGFLLEVFEGKIFERYRIYNSMIAKGDNKYGIYRERGRFKGYIILYQKWRADRSIILNGRRTKASMFRIT